MLLSHLIIFFGELSHLSKGVTHRVDIGGASVSQPQFSANADHLGPNANLLSAANIVLWYVIEECGLHTRCHAG